MEASLRHEIRRPGMEGVGSEPVHDGFAHLIGKSAAFRAAVHKARVVARLDTAVMLHAETGAGTNVFARAIHDDGPRRNGPFVAVDLCGMPRELIATQLFGQAEGAADDGATPAIEAADGGTLFLSGIADLPLEVQSNLIRVLETGELAPCAGTQPRKVRFRLITSSHPELRREVHAERFRGDLYRHASAATLLIPPLRERKDDIPELAAYFADLAAERYHHPRRRFAPEVLDAFASYAWMGNVRELRNIVTAMTVLSEDDPIGLDCLPEEALTPSIVAKAACSVPLTGGLQHAARETIDAAIRAHQGNLTNAARFLGISRSTLYLKLKRFGLEPGLAEARQHAADTT